ncbi:MAG TPA: lamin tail domain-containing protein [Candidatus Saccharimonadales bacterium]|nr:lamin tail domain-containing protein [Candidatus Saccharimonadales bacterium]
MRKVYVLLSLFIVIAVCLFSQQVAAISKDVVISQLQLGTVDSARNELIELYNNSSSDVDITNWCLYYASATSEDRGNKLTCFIPSDEDMFLFLPAYTQALAVSTHYATFPGGVVGDVQFAPKLSGTAGHVRLYNGVDEEIDRIGWGETAMAPEGQVPATVSDEIHVMTRYNAAPNTLVDSDENSNDFLIALPRTIYLHNLTYEVQDLCTNIAGLQDVVPTAYIIDDSSLCVEAVIIDVCDAIPGIQPSLPPGVMVDGLGECVAQDLCPNLSEVQYEILDGFEVSSGGDCVPIDLPPLVVEILPNASGSDVGSEFIEIYNPNDVKMNLDKYTIQIGPSHIVYHFPTNSFIEPHEYKAFYNTGGTFTLPNVASYVEIAISGESAVGEVIIYDSPKDNMSWALIDDVWQYTNRPTPGQANLSSIVKPEAKEIIAVKTLKPCADHQYRSPQTNRCRNNVTSLSLSSACREGQERNPATNRCKAIAAVLGATDSRPCEEGKERNPETNRCRTIESMSQADYKPEQVIEPAGNYIGWWVIGGVAIIAIGYGVWEWRQDIGKLFQRIGSFHFKK